MMTVISQAWTLINYTGDAIKIGLHLKTIYEDWNSLGNSEDSTSIKVMTIFDMVMHGIDIVAMRFAIRNRQFEYRHHILKNQLDTELYEQGMQLAQRAFHAWQSYDSSGASPPPPATFSTFSLLKAQKAFEGVKRSVDGYRDTNAILEKLQWISFGSQLIRQLRQRTVMESIDSLSQLVLDKASSILSFRSKAHCDIYLQPSSRVMWLISPLVKISSVVSFMPLIRTIQEQFRKYFMKPAEIVIGKFKLKPFTLPSDWASWHYEKIPPILHGQAPFKDYRCAKTGIPITQPLFIVKNNQAYLFEKETLIAYINEQKRTHQPLKIPLENIPPDQAESFKEADLYVDSAFQGEFDSALIALRAQDN